MGWGCGGWGRERVSGGEGGVEELCECDCARTKHRGRKRQLVLTSASLLGFGIFFFLLNRGCRIGETVEVGRGDREALELIHELSDRYARCLPNELLLVVPVASV